MLMIGWICLKEFVQSSQQEEEQPHQKHFSREMGRGGWGGGVEEGCVRALSLLSSDYGGNI